jgi:hypothetical protein
MRADMPFAGAAVHVAVNFCSGSTLRPGFQARARAPAASNAFTTI